MHALVHAGKVRYLGLSEAPPEIIRRAAATASINAVQSEYSLFTRDPEHHGVLAMTRELGIAFVAYSPIGRGALTGTFKPEHLAPDDFRRSVPRLQGENFEQNRAIVARVVEIAREVGATPAQVALAWGLAQGEDIISIPGTKRVKYLEENVRAADLRLTPLQLTLLAAVAPEGAVGARYPPGSGSAVGR